MISSALIGKWWASPGIEDFFQKVEFRADRTGKVVSDGGQTGYLDADFLWELTSPGGLILRFQTTKRSNRPAYVPSALSLVHEISCLIEEGQFAFHEPGSTGTITYRRRLQFTESPVPIDADTHSSDRLKGPALNRIDPRAFLVFYSGDDTTDGASSA